MFHRLLDGVVRLRAGDRGQIDRLAALYAPRTYVTHPMAPSGYPPLTTREALREHFTAGADRMGGRPRGFRAGEISLHDTTDPEVVIAEFVYQGEAGDRPFRVPCVFVLRVRDGLIVESHDYIDHHAMARAVDG